jgi:putative oxidoreductase
MIDVDLGLTILRVFVGVLIAGHGAQKLFGLFGGPGLSGTTGMMGSLGLKPARALGDCSSRPEEGTPGRRTA